MRNDLYVILDTNVLISGMLGGKSNTPPRIVLDMILSGKAILFYSEKIFQEYQEVMMREKFHFSREECQLILRFIRENGIKIEPHSSGERLPDENDLPFYDLLETKNIVPAFLITGNVRHYPQEKAILTPREMIELVL